MKKVSVVILSLVMFVSMIGCGESKGKNNDVSNTTQPESSMAEVTIEEKAKNKTNGKTNADSSNITLTQASYNGVLITFPCDKSAFDGTGWSWDEKYATKDLGDGYQTSGGRIGKYPGGVVVNVYNNTGATKKIQDCKIDSGTFYNPGDGSEKVTFVGGLGYDSTMEEVKSKMSSLGYDDPKETQSGNIVKMRYFKDAKRETGDRIEFNFSKEVLKDVTIVGKENK